MSFLLAFTSCKPFVYLIGSLLVSSVFGLLKLVLRGGKS